MRQPRGARVDNCPCLCIGWSTVCLHEKEVVGVLHGLGVRVVDTSKGERSSWLRNYFDDAFVSADCGLRDEENISPVFAYVLRIIKDRTDRV